MRHDSPDPNGPAHGKYAARRTSEGRIAAALDLGWRVAELHALADQDLPEPDDDALLPGHDRLPPPDRLELQVRTTAGDARRIGVSVPKRCEEDLVALALAAPGSDERRNTFRAALRDLHVRLDKQLWAHHEAEGKAYELGNRLSDTWNRVCRAYLPGSDRSPEQAWREVFNECRIERLKHLINDLQSRLDPGAATVVLSHLDEWRASVERRLADPGTDAPPLPTCKEDAEPLRRQTLIWRQLLTGDKEPEAYLEPADRARVRRELIEGLWTQYRHGWSFAISVIVAGVAGLLALGWGSIEALYSEHAELATLITGFLASLAGIFGISKASIVLAARKSVGTWTELMWHRSLAAVIGEVTGTQRLRLFPDPPPVSERARRRAREARVKVGETVRRGAEAGPPPAPSPRG